MSDRNPAIERETYALAREMFLANAFTTTGAALASTTTRLPTVLAGAALVAWDLAAAFVVEAQRRQPEAWAAVPPKERP